MIFSKALLFSVSVGTLPPLKLNGVLLNVNSLKIIKCPWIDVHSKLTRCVESPQLRDVCLCLIKFNNNNSFG